MKKGKIKPKKKFMKFMKMIWDFIKFYYKQLRHKLWFLIGLIPLVLDLSSFWLGDKLLAIPILQKLIEFRWVFLLIFLLLVHIYIIYKTWRQPESSVIQTTLIDEELPYRQKEIAKYIEGILENHGIKSSFTDKYRNGFKHLNHDTPFAASEYYAAFRQVEQIFLKRSTYSGDLNEGLLSALKGGLVSLKKFSDRSKNNADQLRKIIDGLEDAFGSLFAYII